MGKNLHKAYYKDYFADVDLHQIESQRNSNTIKRRNKDLTKSGLFVKEQNTDKIFNASFSLEVLYPGLVTGVGINHETKIEGEFKLGMHFNWTTGQPVIYGSSVKGILRSYFKDFYTENPDNVTIGQIIDDIFEGKGKSIYNRDIFFDSVIVKPDKSGRILCSDSITPHVKGPLKNPIPITFMKIAPGCTLEFRFKLVDTKIGDFILTANQKLNIFKEILTTVGIGAKTNVGYGQMKAIN